MKKNVFGGKTLDFCNLWILIKKALYNCNHGPEKGASSAHWMAIYLTCGPWQRKQPLSLSTDAAMEVLSPSLVPTCSESQPHGDVGDHVEFSSDQTAPKSLHPIQTEATHTHTHPAPLLSHVGVSGVCRNYVRTPLLPKGDFPPQHHAIKSSDISAITTLSFVEVYFTSIFSIH